MIIDLVTGPVLTDVVEQEGGDPQVQTVVRTQVVYGDTDDMQIVQQDKLQTLERDNCTSLAYVAEPGPAGPPGPQGPSGDEEMPYSERTDFVGETVIYRGYAVPGTLDSAPLWRIKRMDIGVDGDVTTTWANGSADFVHSWASRASYTYS